MATNNEIKTMTGEIPTLTHEMIDKMFYEAIRPQKLDGPGLIKTIVNTFKGNTTGFGKPQSPAGPKQGV